MDHIKATTRLRRLIEASEMLLGAATKAMSDVLAEVRTTNSVATVASKMYGFKDFHALSGMSKVSELEQRYLQPLKAALMETAA